MTDTAIPCARCKAPGAAAWAVCADPRKSRVLCAACDLEANRLMLAFLRVRGKDRKLAQYARTMDRRPLTRARLTRNGYTL